MKGYPLTDSLHWKSCRRAACQPQVVRAGTGAGIAISSLGGRIRRKHPHSHNLVGMNGDAKAMYAL